MATPQTMAALGDSITVAYDATRVLAAQPEYSWATGSVPAVNSIALRLEERSADTTLTTANHAVPGARIANLPMQVDQVAAGTDLVLVLIGANDACTSREASMTAVDAFAELASTALDALADRGVDQVVVASIPDLYQLWEVGSTSGQATATWSLFGICQSMLANPTSTAQPDQARRERVRDRVVEFNEALRDACADLAGQGTACTFDDDAVFESPFTLGDLSTVDYFHPSPSGQAALADVVYRASGYEQT